MERTELIEEIIRRVTEKLNQLDQPAPEEQPSDQRPGLLILTQAHGTQCHQLLESQAVGKRWKVTCALEREYRVELSEYEAVVLGDLSCAALGLIASGVESCDYTRLAIQAILSGKKVYILEEGVELYRYRETAPKGYYKMLRDKLSFLESNGAILRGREDLERILTGEKSPTKASAPECSGEKEKRLSKRVLTERDLIEAEKEGFGAVRVDQGCIITALAKDSAVSRGIRILKDQS